MPVCMGGDMEVGDTTGDDSSSSSVSASEAAAIAAAAAAAPSKKEKVGWVCDITFKPFTGVRGEYGGVSRDDLDAMLVRAEHIVHAECERRRSEAMTKRSSALLVGKGISYRGRKWTKKDEGKKGRRGGGVTKRKRRNYAAEAEEMA